MTFTVLGEIRCLARLGMLIVLSMKIEKDDGI